MSDLRPPDTGVVIWRLQRLEDDVRDMRPTADKVERMTTDIAVLSGKVEAAQVAVAKAEGAMEKRLEGMNEFRDSLRDQNSTFATKESVEERTDLIHRERRQSDERLGELELRIARAEGRAAAYTVAVGIFVSIVAIAARFL